MSDKYILDKNGNPQPCSDLMEWATWFEAGNRRIGNDTILIDDEEVRVSTVFLGIDHSLGGSEPELFETMIFGGKHDQYQERYATREEAIIGHSDAVKLVTG